MACAGKMCVLVGYVIVWRVLVGYVIVWYVLVGYVMLCVKYGGRLYGSCCVMVRGVMVCDGEYNIGKVISL